MNFLYIGQNTSGTTSKMRAAQLKSILKPNVFQVIDTHIPFYQVHRLLQSLAFRYKIGPLINKINRYVLSRINKKYDVIWVDKGVYLNRHTTTILRNSTHKLIHYTPDPAFVFHNSVHFNKSLPFYDFAVTTKSYELDYYKSYLDSKQIILTSQGFDKNIHFPQTEFSKKRKGVVFIGHFEKDRGAIILALDHAGISVTVAGKKWGQFLKKNSELKNVNYLGEGIYGNEYSKQISNHIFGLGFLSKWIPELHTTRTFEIPACGTALITESNEETTSFFKSGDAVFYHNTKELVNKVREMMAKPKELESITLNGYNKVINGGYDYESLLKKILHQINL